MKKNKICFLLLNYQQDTHRHYYHIYEFIDKLAMENDMRLLIMDTEGEPQFSHPSQIICFNRKRHGKWDHYRTIWRAWRDGYRIFYNHYTTGPARFCAVLTRFFGGKTYLWHCIVMDALEKMVGSRAINRWLLKKTLQMVHHLVTGSDRMADYYSEKYCVDRKKIIVIPNYINLDRFSSKMISKQEAREQLALPVDTKIVLYLHELEEGRSKKLPEIVRGVMNTRNDVFFLIAGDGRYRDELQSALSRYVSEGRVRFDGSIPNTKAPVYYASSDVYIMTSEFEAFSRVLLEAMAMGVPYVATDGGGSIRSYTPSFHQPFILSHQDCGKFPEKISDLLDDEKTRSDFIEAGNLNVQKYELGNVIEIFKAKIFGI